MILLLIRALRYRKYICFSISRYRKKGMSRIERVYNTAVYLLANRDAGRTAFLVINRYIRFVDKEKAKNMSVWKLN